MTRYRDGVIRFQPRPIHRAARCNPAAKVIDQAGRTALNCQVFSPKAGARRPRGLPLGPFWRTVMGFKVAVVGATGNVGREMLEILAERRFPADEVVALASRKSMGVEVSYGEKTLKCKTL